MMRNFETATNISTQSKIIPRTPLIKERLEAQLLCPVPKSMPHNGTSSFKGVTKLGFADCIDRELTVLCDFVLIGRAL